MRRLMIMLLVLLVAAPAGFARRKKKKAGSVEDQVYVDTKYDFQLTLPEGWKYKVGDEDDHFRLYLTQKDFEVPPYYLDAEDYTLVPKIVVWVDTTTMGATPFVDSLVSDTYESDQKKEILKEFELLNASSAGSGTYRDPLVPMGRRIVQVGDLKGVRWAGRCTYMKEVALSASATGSGKRVRGAYEGTVTAIKKGNVIVVFHMMCESLYYDAIDGVMTQIVESLKFSGGNDEEG